MRVLLSCYAFSPYRGSESAVGWNIAKELARHSDVTVICGDVEAKREVGHELERWQREGNDISSLHFAYVGPTRLIALIEKLHHLPGCWALYYLAYRLWQKQAYKRAVQLHRENPFDLVHHVTMIGYREPGYMWKLPIPFVWGPVGGSPNEPIGFWSIYSMGARVNVLLRNLLNWLQKHFMVRPRLAARKASKIWAVTDDDVRTIQDIWGKQCEKMIETASTPATIAKIRSYHKGEKLHIVWSGTYTYGKALPILIKALGRLGISNEELGNRVQVDVMGKGPEVEKWKLLTKQGGVADCFSWRGYLPHDEAMRIMNDAHVLAFTSVKEGTPHVVLEALSLGIPVICHNVCGMGVAVTSDCGIKVPMIDPGTSINGFAEAIKRIIDEPEIVERMSIGALKRAAQLTWKTKVEAIYGAYEQILDAKAKI